MREVRRELVLVLVLAAILLVVLYAVRLLPGSEMLSIPVDADWAGQVSDRPGTYQGP